MGDSACLEAASESPKGDLSYQAILYQRDGVNVRDVE
jgi:hypothetical protein